MNVPIFRPIIALLLLTPLITGAEQTSKLPKVSAKLVAESVAWQAHWDNEAGVTSKVPAMLTVKIHDRSEAWVSDLDWVINFADWDGQPLPNFVHRLSAESEARQSIMSPFAALEKVTVELPDYTNRFHKIRSLGPDIQQKLLSAFQHEACNAETLAYYKDGDGHPIKKIRFWIAPVDTDFPVMLYFVEGVSYTGKVYFHTQSLKPLHSEFNYIGDPGDETQKQGLKLMDAIKSEGDLFELKDGHLAPVAH